MLRSTTRSVQLLTRVIPKRTFTQSAITRNAAGIPSSLQTFTEEELMLKDAGNRNSSRNKKQVIENYKKYLDLLQK